MTDKQYVRHSGHPGGQTIQSPADLMKKFPERIIEKAVRGMLPKNRLGSALFRNLYVFEGSEHPHEAQKPKVVDLTSIIK